MLAFLLAVATGCQPKFDGIITFHNGSGRNLADASVAGFEREPPVSAMNNGVGGHCFMGPMAVPAAVTITWRFAGEPAQQSVVSLAGVPADATYGELLFVLTKKNQWTFRFNSKNECSFHPRTD